MPIEGNISRPQKSSGSKVPRRKKIGFLWQFALRIREPAEATLGLHGVLSTKPTLSTNPNISFFFWGGGGGGLISFLQP